MIISFNVTPLRENKRHIIECVLVKSAGEKIGQSHLLNTDYPLVQCIMALRACCCLKEKWLHVKRTPSCGQIIHSAAWMSPKRRRRRRNGIVIYLWCNDKQQRIYRPNAWNGAQIKRDPNRETFQLFACFSSLQHCLISFF